MSWDPPPAPPGWGQPPVGPPPMFGPPPPGGMGPGPQLEPDRSMVVLLFGIFSMVAIFIGCVICGPLALLSFGLSIPAIIMGKKDLAAIDAGRMDPRGRDATMIGFILALVSAAISALWGLVMLVLFAFYGAVILAALASPTGGFQ